VGHLNIEIKARSNDHKQIREYLKAHKADFMGIDHQVDTYFKVPKDRLKSRQGNIENALIHYQRSDQAGPKESLVTLYNAADIASLNNVLINALDILVIVDKQREIVFLDNVKFHLDIVKDLGTFIEIEAIDQEGKIGKDKLYEQCRMYLNVFGVSDDDLLEQSYSDLLMR
jgi:adenylate cyclase class 2